MSTISASTTSTTAFKVTADTTGALVFQTGASPTTAMTLGSDQSVTFAGTPTYSGGTANGVAYLNGSKVFTTGTALVFDGANLGVGVTSPSGIIHAKGSANYTSIIVDNSSTTGGGSFVARQNGSTKAYFGVSGAIEGNTSSDAGVFAETGGVVKFYTNGSATPVGRFDTSGNLLINATSPTSYGNFTNNKPTAVLANSSSTGARSFTSTYATVPVASTTMDIWLPVDGNGNNFGTNVLCGHFYIYVRANPAADGITAIYTIVTTGNGTTGATLTAVSSVTRGTNPVTSFSIADVSGGSIKLRATYNGTFSGSGGLMTVVYVGSIF